MSEPGERPEVHYYTDLLCVWAWIAQPRLEEVASNWGERIQIRHRCVDVFGDAHSKILGRWGDADGFERFADHLQAAGEPHPEARLNPELWRSVRPTGSQPGHLFIKAAELTAGDEAAAHYARELREAFFVHGRDVSDRSILVDVARASGLDESALADVIDRGEAHAALTGDLNAAQAGRIVGSPTWVMNDGRQVLYGNVGYRVIHANLEEFLRQDPGGASWC